MNFDQAFVILIGNEGGYSNDPHDAGGETQFGISKRAYPDVDIKNLTLDQAKAIYKRDYWDKAQADQYDGQVGFHVFDAAVNSGIGTAIRLLQRAVGVKDDGVVGPATLAAVSAVSPVKLILNMNAERLTYMTNLMAWDNFSKGWARRIANNLKLVEA